MALGVTCGLVVACQSPSPPLGVRPGGPVLPTGIINGDFIETRSEAETRFDGAPAAESEPYTVLFEAGDVHVTPSVAMPSGALLTLNLAVFPLDGECLWGDVAGVRTAEFRVSREADALEGFYAPSVDLPWSSVPSKSRFGFPARRVSTDAG